MSQDRPFTAKSFCEFLREKALMGSVCQDCKTIMVPPRMVCVGCRGERLRWSQMSGKGSLETFTIVHVAPAFLKDKAPYAVGIVKLEEGPMITARLVGLDVLEPETFQIGMPLVADYTEEGGKPLLVFRPA
ncbi:MAG: Zn-ribbon domain-containing OB-fold protein [Candidatus Bathyarchaeia archaeon]